MRIRGKICGKKPLDVARIQHERPPEIRRKSFRNLCATLQQAPDPQPGEAAKGNLQTAGPVDSHAIWVLLLPVIPLPEQLLCIPRFGRQTISLGQSDKVLVAIEFPNDLRVARLVKVEIAHPEPCGEGHLLAMHSIKMPIYFRAVVNAFVPEKVEAVPVNLLGVFDNFLNHLRSTLTKPVDNLRHLFRPEKEAAASLRPGSTAVLHEPNAHSAQQEVRAFCNFLSRAHTQFFPIHP